MSSAFKSTTKRTSIGGRPVSAADDSRATPSHRRSRSLNRFSRRASTAGDYQTPARRGKFVNTSRGAGFPEISLDDLALEIFESADRWRSDGVEVSSSNSSRSSQRRGRSVSRHGLRNNCVDGGTGGDWSRQSDVGGRVVPDSVKTRRRSVSVARYGNSDTESEVEAFGMLKNKASLNKSSIANWVTPSSQLSRRSMSHKDLLKLHDGYSSQSSALTDEEPRNIGFSRNGDERTIRTVYAQKAEHPIGEDINTGLYTAMRKELRNAVEDIRLGLEQAMVHNNLANCSENFQPMATPTEKNAAKLDQKQDNLDDILLDGELDPDISKIMSDFLMESENDTVVEKPQKTRKRSNDKRRMSKELIQEAEQYFEDFLSNVEDTDLSSFEGERSDCGSCVGKIKRPNYPVTYFDKTDTFQTPAKSSCTPVEMDDVVLPWLQWETSNDISPASCNKKSDAASAAALSNAPQDGNAAHYHSSHSNSSISNCSPEAINGQSPGVENSSKSSYTKSPVTYKTEPSTKAPFFDMDDYMDIARKEELTMETWRQQSRISNGSVHLCSPMFL
ncbi:unnamed protein product [Rhodiola kirilowii]